MKMELETRDAMIVGFGGTTLLALIIIGSIYVGHAITTASAVPQPIHINSTPAQVSVNVPQQAAPRVEVSTAAPHVSVNVPQQAAPTVNVTTPPAVVHVVEKTKEIPSTPVITPTPIEKKEPGPLPVSTQSKAEAPKNDLETLYASAEKYISSFCAKRNLDPDAESRKWILKWKARVETAINDGGSEQSLLDRTIIDQRECFDINATPDKVAEGCRILLHMRDAKLQWLQAMREALNAENMQKTIAFLTAGPK